MSRNPEETPEETPRPLTEAEAYEMARLRAQMKLAKSGRPYTQREVLREADKLFAAENERLRITS